MKEDLLTPDHQAAGLWTSPIIPAGGSTGDSVEDTSFAQLENMGPETIWKVSRLEHHRGRSK
jgi:hypothetical protein